MPHLSPLNWAFAFIMFWVFLFMLVSMLWWQQSPAIKAVSRKPLSTSLSSWCWS